MNIDQADNAPAPGQVKFVERRSGQDRRQQPDPCATLPLDLYHRKRRKQPERRTAGRTPEQHRAAYYDALLTRAGAVEAQH